MHTVEVLIHSGGVLRFSGNLVNPSMASAIALLVTDAHASVSFPPAMSFRRLIILEDN